MSYPARCYCKKRGCRVGRPLCRRTDVPRNLICMCSAYHYPHRIGSGSCVHHPDHVKRQFEANTGLKWDGSNQQELALSERRSHGFRKMASKKAS